MNETFMLYLLTRLDDLSTLCTLIAIFGSMIWGLAWIPLSIEGVLNKHLNKHKKTMMKLLWIPIIAAVFSVLLPSKNDVIFIIAGTGLIEISKTDTAQRLASKSVLVFEQYLDKLAEKSK